MFCLSWYTHTEITPKVLQAARLCERKFQLLRRFPIPPELLPGSLSLIHRRCSQPTYHSATNKKGHPVWSHTFVASGKKHVEWIPKEWTEDVQRFVDAGQEFKEAMSEVFAANAQLLVVVRNHSVCRDSHP